MVGKEYFVIKGEESSNFKRLCFFGTPTPKIEVEFMSDVKNTYYLNNLIRARHYWESKNKYFLELTFFNGMKEEIIGNIYPLILELSRI